MKKWKWIAVFLLAALLSMPGCSQQGKGCFPEELFSLPSPIGEWGQDNLAYLNLNTFDGVTFMVNQYDENGNWISDPPAAITIMNSKGQDGSFCFGSFDTGKRKASMTITMGKNPQLDVEHVEKYFCPDAVQELLSKYQGAEQGNVALVDLQTKEIIPLQKSVHHFRLGNYTVSCEYRSAKGKSEIHVEVIYSPVINLL